jgi:hypothetical protein
LPKVKIDAILKNVAENKITPAQIRGELKYGSIENIPQEETGEV